MSRMSEFAVIMLLTCGNVNVVECWHVSRAPGSQCDVCSYV